MLSEKLFKDAIADFADYYGKKLVDNPLAYSAWHEHLSAHLTDIELIPCLKLAIKKFKFMPSPTELIDEVFGSQDTLAYEEWNKCTHAATQNDQEDLLLSAHAEKALHALGGIKRLKEVEPEKMHGILAKDFVRLWLQYKNAIASGLVEAPKPLLKAVPDLPKPEEPLATPEQWQKYKSRLNNLFNKEKDA